MRKSQRSAALIREIRNSYCVTGTAVSARELSKKVGIKPQHLNRIIKGLARSGDIVLIGGNKPRQSAYLLPSNALIPPRLLRERRTETTTALLNDVQIGLTALHLNRFFRRNLRMSSIEAYLVQMSENPTVNWENEDP